MKLKATGVQGLDEMLGGGFPEETIILICGGPGAGKTILSIQCMVQALSRDEPCVFATFEEPLKKIRKNVSAFGWDLESWERKGLLKTFDVLMDPRLSFMNVKDSDTGEIEFSTTGIIKMAETMKAKYVVIDPLTSLLIHESRSGRKRFIIGDLFDSLRKLECNAILTSEIAPQAGDFYMEQFLADGVVLLNKDIWNYSLVKTIRIEKMRWLEYDEQPRRYAISSSGFQVMSKEPVIM
jgi:circadian clock protein KaiC